MTRRVRQTLWIAVVGSFVDAAGDEGTRIARGTILQNVWPSTNTITFQNFLLLGLVGLIVVVIAATSQLKRLVGYGVCAVGGAAATFVTQALLLINWQVLWER